MLYAPKINKALRQQYLDFIANYDEYGMRAVDKIDTAPLRRIIQDLYIDAGLTYGLKVRADLNNVKGRMPIGFSERMRQLITEYFQTDIFNVIERIAEETKRRIREVFTMAYEAGEGISDIIAKLKDTDLSKTRARLIARTETVTAANKGAQFVAKDTGLKLNKEWLSANDNRVRHDHRLINGQIVAMDDYFKVGGYEMEVPGDRGGKNGKPKVPAKEVVNCRCTTLYEPVRDSHGVLIRV